MGRASIAIAESRPVAFVGGNLKLSTLAFVVVSEATAAFESEVTFANVVVNAAEGVPILEQGTFIFRPSIE
ncbi:MAG: hypothetical protein EBZ10_04295, partial [Actinobacteria bacterium]|nr:hypothetical protein [Actinomycetota bacterium]